MAQEEPAVQQGQEQRRYPALVGVERRAVVARRLRAEVDGERGSVVVRRRRHRARGQRRAEPPRQAVAQAGQVLEGGRRQLAQHRQTRSQGHRVAGEGAALADAPPGRRIVPVHDVGAPAEGAHREAAADDLPERGQVGRDPVVLLRAAARQPEADDLVEDHQHAVPGGDLAHAADEVRRQIQDPALGIQHDARQLGGMLADQPLGRLQVAERQHHRVGHRPGRHADRLRVGQRPLCRTGRLQRRRD